MLAINSLNKAGKANLRAVVLAFPKNVPLSPDIKESSACEAKY